MQYKTLGNMGPLVSKLCFGTMTFGDGRGLFKAISAVGQAGADKKSIDGGTNFFDTADDYPEAESEKASESGTLCHGDGPKDGATVSGRSSCCRSSDARRTGRVAAILRISGRSRCWTA